MRAGFVSATFLFVAGAFAANPDAAITGFDHFYNLEYDAAVEDFEDLAKQEPLRAASYNHLAQALLYREMERSGLLGSDLLASNNSFLKSPKVEVAPDAERRFLFAIERAMELSTATLARDASHRQALYELGVTHGLRANYNFLVKRAFMAALKDANASRKLHARLIELDPTNIDAQLVPATHEYILGSLGPMVRALASVAGFHGDKKLGIRMLETVARQGIQNKIDASILLCVVYRREGRPADALPLLREMEAQYPRNYLSPIEMANMYADMGNSAKVVEMAELLYERHDQGAPGYANAPMGRLRTELASIEMRVGLHDAAISTLRIAAAEPDAKRPALASRAWMHLGQAYDLKQSREQARLAYAHAIAAAPDSPTAIASRKYLSAPFRTSGKLQTAGI